MIGVANPTSILEDLMDADLDTLATALYARIDDTLKARPELAPWRPKVGIAPKLSDAELLTLAVMQALLGHANEARWLRHAGSASDPSVPVSAWSGRVQQAAAQVRRAAAGDDPAARRGHRRVGRRHLADRLDTDRVRPLGAHDATLPASPAGPATATARRTPGSSGGCACTSCAPRPGCRSRSPWPTRSSTNATSPSTCSTPTRPARRPRTVRRSSPTRATPRPSSNAASPTTASNWSARPAPTNARRRGAPQLRTPASDHRVGQQHPQSPAQPRTHGGHSPKASPSGSSNDSSPSPPRSGTTTTATNPSFDRSPPTTTGFSESSPRPQSKIATSVEPGCFIGTGWPAARWAATHGAANDVPLHVFHSSPS